MLIAIAVFSMSILLAQNNVEKVFALTVSQASVGNLGGSGLNMVYSSSLGRYVLNFGSGVIKTVNPSTHAVAQITLTISGSDNTFNSGIYCESGLCYTSSFGLGNPDVIYQFNPITGTVSDTFTVGCTGDGTDIEITGCEAVGTTVLDNSRLDDGWHSAACEVGGFRVLFKVTGQQIGVCNSSGISGTLVGVEVIGTNVVTTASVATNAFRVFNINTGVQSCVANINLLGGALGQMTQYNGFVYFTSGTTTVSKYNTSCVAQTGITNHGLTTTINGLTPVASQGVFAIRSTTTVAFMNLSSANISVLAYSVALNATDTQTSHRRDTMPLAGNQLGTLVDTSTATDLIVFIDLAPAEEEEEGTSDFCAIAGNENLLRCRLEEQGGALGGNFQGNPFDVSNSTSNILIQTGFLSGDDTNPATNGTGYLILAIALVIVNGLLWVATSGGAFTRANLFLPALISLVVVAGFTIAGLVDATVLIISIVVLVALAAPRVFERLAGGGSTE